MESKNIARVTFTLLVDVKAVMVMVAGRLDEMLRAYRMMSGIGVRANSPAMAEARKDVTNTLRLAIAVGEEFRRLHVDCECATTDAEIDEGNAIMRKILAEVQRDTVAAGPIDRDPEHAVDDLQKFLGVAGFDVPEGFDRMQIPGMSVDPNEGTGLYL